MKKSILTLALAVGAFTMTFAQKMVSEKGQISFLSHTSIEDIKAENSKIKSSLDMGTGDLIISVPMQSYKFENATMQKHYNSAKFLDTKQFPKSKFKGKITNLSDIDFGTDGTYDAKVKGTLTMHGEMNPVIESAKITVAGSTVTLNSTMEITLADYKVAFEKGKPSKSIAKTIDTKTTIEFTK